MLRAKQKNFEEEYADAEFFEGCICIYCVLQAQRTTKVKLLLSFTTNENHGRMKQFSALEIQMNGEEAKHL